VIWLDIAQFHEDYTAEDIGLGFVFFSLKVNLDIVILVARDALNAKASQTSCFVWNCDN
jgi:hypothetical protein